MIRVLLADDHVLVREGLKALLAVEDDIEVVGEVGDGDECLEQALVVNPDVVLMDINMPRCNGLEALGKLKDEAPDVCVLVLTMHNDEGYLRRVLASGGSGFLLKQAAADELLTAIRTVYDGGVFLMPEHAAALAKPSVPRETSGDTAASDPSKLYGMLSEREAEVFRLVALGHRNSDIAAELFLSVKTVETYKSRLMRKLGLDSRASLVRFALDLGILDR